MVAEGFECTAGDEVAVDVEQFVDGTVGGQKLLGCPIKKAGFSVFVTQAKLPDSFEMVYNR